MKKIIFALCSLIILSFTSIGLAGTSDLNNVNNFTHTISEDEILENERRMEEHKNNMLQFNQSFFKSLSVPIFEQETSYYCGPATVKQTLQFINANSSSQSVYAGRLGTKRGVGTNLDNIRILLNTDQSRRNYISTVVSSEFDFQTKQELALRANVPTILHIKAKTTDGWKYDTSGGHFLNGSGLNYHYDVVPMHMMERSSITESYVFSKIKVTDPWGEGLGNTWYNTRTVYKNLKNRLGLILY
ncbi:MAG: hypothetical protein COA82_12525 [Alkaliphilus sp.]|nr:MAG: hypothetical protein COA82_12525 [Alkaliphilus sp.]